jgi:hypothetical protein
MKWPPDKNNPYDSNRPDYKKWWNLFSEQVFRKSTSIV